MKRLVTLLAAALVLTFTVGCDETTKNTSATPNNEFDETCTIQGTVFNAVTGARIADSSLEITMVRGTSYVSPSMLETNTNKPTRLGDFVFKNVPISLADNVTYRITVSMTGYETFEGTFSPVANIYDEGEDGVSSTQDSLYNYVANIYLNPQDTVLPDYTFYVRYANEPVVGATVQIELVDAYPFTDTFSPLGLDDFHSTILTATTDASGLAVFDGDDLILWGEYEYKILPIAHEGVQLEAYYTGASFYAGDTNTEMQLNMTDLSPDSIFNGLYIVSATNEDLYAPVATGVLTVTFNRAVTLIDETDVLATRSHGSAVLDASDLPNSSVTVTGSGTTTLTFTPVITTQPATTDSSVYISYGPTYVTVGDDTAYAIDVFAVDTVDNAAISNRVYITGEK